MSYNQFYPPYINPEKVLTPTAGGFSSNLVMFPIENVAGIIIDTPVLSDVYQISSKAGTSPFVANTIDPKRSITEEQKDDGDGPYMLVTVNGLMPFESYNNHKLFDLMKYDKWILMVTTFSGLVRVIGDLDNPAVFSHKFDSGTGSKNYPGTMMTFTWKTEDKPRLYNHATINLGGGGGTIIVGQGNLSGV